MSIHDVDLISGMDKVQISIERIRMFCRGKRVMVAFSGGKDSQTVYHLAQMAGIAFTGQYSVTRFDPPLQVRFIREQYPDVVWRRNYRRDLIHDIERAGLPTRWCRWCCSAKHEETPGFDIVLVGVRAAESARRRATWSLFRHSPGGNACLCPIIDWTDRDVWEFLNENGIPHCRLYDMGEKRLGCVMCPLCNQASRDRDYAREPKMAAMLRRGSDLFVRRMRAQGWVTKRGTHCLDWCEAASPEDEYWERWRRTGQTAMPLDRAPADDSDQQCLFAGSGFSESDAPEIDED